MLLSQGLPDGSSSFHTFLNLFLVTYSCSTMIFFLCCILSCIFLTEMNLKGELSIPIGNRKSAWLAKNRRNIYVHVCVCVCAYKKTMQSDSNWYFLLFLSFWNRRLQVLEPCLGQASTKRIFFLEVILKCWKGKSLLVMWQCYLVSQLPSWTTCGTWGSTAQSDTPLAAWISWLHLHVGIQPFLTSSQLLEVWGLFGLFVFVLFCFGGS